MSQATIDLATRDWVLDRPRPGRASLVSGSYLTDGVRLLYVTARLAGPSVPAGAATLEVEDCRTFERGFVSEARVADAAWRLVRRAA